MKIIFIAVILLNLLTTALLHSQVVGWGGNIAGEVTGIPSRGYVTGVVQVASDNLSRPIAIAVGDAHALMLKEDGTVFGWGWDYFGQATGFDTRTEAKGSGPVVLAGGPLRGVKAIAAAENLSVALKNDGTVVTWGSVTDPQNGEVALPVNVSNVTAIAVGMCHVLVLKSDGTVASFGEAFNYGKPTTPAGLSNVVAIAASAGLYGQDLAVKRNGTVVAWKFNGPGGLLPTPVGLSNVVRVAAGWGHNLALTRDGRVYGWGANWCGQATGIANTNSPDGGSGFVTISGKVLSNVVAIVASDDYSLALNKDGSIQEWGCPRYVPRNIIGKGSVPVGLSNVVAIAAGRTFRLAITTNAAVAARFRH